MYIYNIHIYVNRNFQQFRHGHFHQLMAMFIVHGSSEYNGKLLRVLQQLTIDGYFQQVILFSRVDGTCFFNVFSSTIDGDFQQLAVDGLCQQFPHGDLPPFPCSGFLQFCILACHNLANIGRRSLFGLWGR